LEIKKFGEVQYREKEKKKVRKEENKKRKTVNITEKPVLFFPYI
jgi:hypothetical protein